MTTRPRLIVVGDSFSVEPAHIEDATLTWARQVAQQLDFQLMNFSQHGVAQDWCFQQLRAGFHAEDAITAEDRIIVCLTHPNRFWFLQDQPTLSNSHIIGLDQYISKDQNRAIQGFMQHIQRPELDTLQMVMRLGWLAACVSRLALAKPLMIRGFAMNVQEAEQYPELSWAQGTLFDMQADEFWDNKTHTHEYFRGLDCRYNHMTLSNHQLLSDKIVDHFKNHSSLDLTQGFIKGNIEPQSKQDLEFCSREFNLHMLKEMQTRPDL